MLDQPKIKPYLAKRFLYCKNLIVNPVLQQKSFLIPFNSFLKEKISEYSWNFNSSLFTYNTICAAYSLHIYNECINNTYQ